MKLIEEANEYIAKNLQNVDKTYRSNYHMEPPIGWMNDPNGLIFWNGKYHLYYQFNPYGVRPSNMAWGHFESPDLIKYSNHGIAIYPEIEKLETGCYTGSAFIENNEPKFIYTRHYKDNEHNSFTESQYICKTKDFMTFIKEDNPCVDINELPREIEKTDFRDPQIFFRNNKWFTIFY